MLTTLSIGYALLTVDTKNPVTDEITALQRLVPRFRVVPLRSGKQALSLTESITIDDLRGKVLDAHPPTLRGQNLVYEPSQDETHSPYLADGIYPFRFKFFTCEFNYGGWHNLPMQEYASTHGFNVIYPYTRKLAERSRMPVGTQWLTWSGYVDWDKRMPDHKIPIGRYGTMSFCVG